MTKNESNPENCTEQETSAEHYDEKPRHEIGTVAISRTYQDGTVKLEGSGGEVEFRFFSPELARATAESILPDGYAVVEEDCR